MLSHSRFPIVAVVGLEQLGLAQLLLDALLPLKLAAPVIFSLGSLVLLCDMLSGLANAEDFRHTADSLGHMGFFQVLTMDPRFGVPSCELLVSALPFASGGKDVSGRLEEPRKASLWSHHLLLLLNVFVTP